MRSQRAHFVTALLRDAVAFVTGLLIGKAWERRNKPAPPPSATEAIAEALKYAEKTRHARK